MIQDLEPYDCEVGDSIEQAGVSYTVIGIDDVETVGAGRRIWGIYLSWDGSDESDTFRTVVNARGYAGKIRWDSPHGMFQQTQAKADTT